MLPQLPDAALPAILLRYLDVAVYAVLLLLFVRYAMREYSQYGYGPWVAALFQLSEPLCRPLRSVLPRSWVGVRDYTPLAVVALIVLVKPFLEAGLVLALMGRDAGGASLPLQAWALSVVYLSTGTQALCVHAAFLGSALLFLAFAWHGLYEFWRPLPLRVLDDATVPFFRRTAARLRLRSPWLVLVAALLWFNLLCGAGRAAAGALGQLLAWPAWGGLPDHLREQFVAVEPDALAAAREVVASLLSSVLLPALILLYVLMGACLILVLWSWFGPDPESRAFRLLLAIAGPPLLLAQRVVPFARFGMIDFSPILLFFALQFAIHLVAGMLAAVGTLAGRLG